MSGRSYSARGFTLVELMVTIVVASIFFVSAYQVMSFIVKLSVARSQDAIASNLAYTNLRQYVSGRAPTWFECDEANPSTPRTIKNSGNAQGLPGPVVVRVTASAPYGCGGLASGMPVRVDSYVEYGVNARRVTHVSYASY